MAPRIRVLATLACGVLTGCGFGIGSTPHRPPVDTRPPGQDTLVQDAPLQDAPPIWTQEQRERFWFTPQGSQVLPYAWFLALEQADRSGLFRAADHMEQLGYIPVEASTWNPDGLPIGFTRDRDPRDGVEHLGFSCAACHTNRVRAGDRDLIIDGAPTLADFEKLERELYAALQQTARSDARFARFADRVLGADAPEPERAKLRADLRARSQQLEARERSNRPGDAKPALVQYGPARLDAFGAIINSVDRGLGAPPSGPARAPVSYPCIWDAGRIDRVQWNGSAFNDAQGRLGRNIGEVLGVFAHLAPPGADRTLVSSVNMDGLEALEQMMLELKSPAWPTSLPPPDAGKVETGQKLYGQYCAACHQRDDATGPREFKAAMVPQCQVGTDPEMLRQIDERRPGLERVLQAVGGVMLTSPCRVLRLTGATVPEPCDDALQRGEMVKQMRARAEETRVDPCADPASCYKAGPLHGVWATAPYLHNGSVPNLWQLLLPPGKRVREFRVGSPEIDPIHVGFRSDAASGGFVFRTGLAGNSSTGHAYGTQLSEADRWALIEYMKTL
jgi:hypothetical protein